MAQRRLVEICVVLGIVSGVLAVDRPLTATAEPDPSPTVIAGPINSDEYGVSTFPSAATPLADFGAFSQYAMEVRVAANGDVYVRDWNQIVRLDPDNGTFQRVIGAELGFGSFSSPSPFDAIGLDVASNEVYVGWNRGRSFDIDSAGRVVFSTGNGIFRVNSSSVLEHIAGVPYFVDPSADGDGGPATEAGVSVAKMYVDGSGAIWFLGHPTIGSDGNTQFYGSARLRRIAPDGTITTYAGTGEAGNDGDGGPATAAKIAATDLAVSPNGDVYLLGSAEDTVTFDTDTTLRRIDAATGVISTITVDNPACGVIFASHGQRTSVESGELRFIGSPWTTSDLYDCRIDVTDGSASMTSLDIEILDIQSNIERDADDAMWFMYNASDDFANSGLVRIDGATPPPPPTDTLVWADVGGTGSLSTGGPGLSPTRLLLGDSQGPAWSPDRSTVVFSSQRDGQTDLWLVDADGTNVRKLTDDNAFDEEPAWSPDGTRIAFASDRGGGSDFEIWTIRTDGTGMRQVTTNDAYDTSPAWSPDGTRLAFASDLDLFTVAAIGGSPTPLVVTPALEDDPDFSPDGSAVAFTYKAGGQDAEVWIVDADGSDLRQVPTPGWSREPTWSPEGTHLAFVLSLTQFANEIWVARADGADPGLVSATGVMSINPDWGEVAIPPPPPSDLEVTATTTAAPISPGGSFTVDITASNVGDGPALGAIVELEVIGATFTSAAPATCTILTSVTMTCPAGDLSSGGSLGWTLTLAAGGGGTAVVTAQLTCPCDDEGDTDLASRSIVAPPVFTSLQVTVSGPTTATQGEVVTYRFTVTNGLSTPANKVQFGYGLVVGTSTRSLTPTSVATDTGSCGQNVRACELGTLAPGQRATITVTALIDVGVDINVAGLVKCNCTDPITTDNRVELRTRVTARADLGLTITNPAKVAGGSPIPWSITVTTPPWTVVHDLVVEFDVPSGVTVISIGRHPNDRSSQPSCVIIGNLVRCTYAQGSGSLLLVGQPTRGGTYHLVGRIVSCGCIDTNPANNVMTGPPTVVPPTVDLVVIKQRTQTQVQWGATITWTVDVTNRGPDTATLVRFLDRLPTGVSFVSATVPGGSCSFRNGAVTCSIDNFAPNSTQRVTVEARATAISPGIVNTAQVWCDCYEPGGTADNSSTAGPVAVIIAIQPVRVTPCSSPSVMRTCNFVIVVPNPNPTQLPGGVVDLGPIHPINGPRIDPTAVWPNWYRCTHVGSSIRCTFDRIPPGGSGNVTVPLLLSGGGEPLNLTATWSCCGRAPVSTTVAPFTPDSPCIGGQVLFESNATGDLDVYAARLDGSSVMNLTNNSKIEDAGAAWAPDGLRFIFHRGPKGARKLYQAILDSSWCIKRVLLIPNQPAADNFQADWSPVEGRIAFVSNRDGNHDIFTIGLDGTGLFKVTSSRMDERAPSYSKDGQTIAFVSQRDRQRTNTDWNIFAVRANGTGERQLTFSPSDRRQRSADYSPSFSRGSGPDRIIWHTDAGSGNWDLWIMDADGSDQQRLPGFTGTDEKNADWSSDGTLVVYDAGTGTAGIRIMNSDGTGRRPVADTGGIDQAPSIHTANAPPLPCGSTASATGGVGTTTQVIEMGQNQGTFLLSWNAYTIKDQFDVLYEGNLLYSSGVQSGSQTVAVPYAGGETAVTVIVRGDENGTIWEFTAGCPTPA